MVAQQLILAEPPLSASGEAPHGKVEAVVPWSWSADQGGRPACPGLQPPRTSSGGLSWPALSQSCVSWHVLSGFALILGLHLLQLSLNVCSDFICDFSSDQSVLATCKLA